MAKVPIKSGVTDYIKKHKQIDQVIFHYVRSMEDYVSYAAIEEVKDGMFYNGKYESSMVIYNPPHIICMANFPPDLDKLSKDRWVVRYIC